jgi:hypothetical protein
MTRRGECRHPMRDRVVLAHVTDGPLYDCNICRRCNTWLPLGESNDAPDEVAIEVRAAELVAHVKKPLGSAFYPTDNEHAGWRDEQLQPLHLSNGFHYYEPPAFNEAEYLTGHLARCIHDHDRITEHGND